MIRARKNLCFLISKQHAGPQTLSGGSTLAIWQFEQWKRPGVSVVAFTGVREGLGEANQCKGTFSELLQKCEQKFVGLIYTFMPAPFSIPTKCLN